MRTEEEIQKIIAGVPELQNAIAALIANTKRQKRTLNLLDIAEKIKFTKKYLSINEIATVISMSDEMVREFARIGLLKPSIKKMISAGKIDSVDIADRLSRLSSSDQSYLAKKIVIGELNSQDLRAIVALRKHSPKASIIKIVNRIKKSKNIREYVVEFIIPIELVGHENIITNALRAIFDKKHIRSLSFQQRLGVMSLDEVGKNTLVRRSREAGVSKGKLIQLILSGDYKNCEQ